MPTTPKGFIYPASSDDTEIWQHFQDLAGSVDTFLDTYTVPPSGSPSGAATYAYKSVDTARSSTIVVANDPHLTQAVVAGTYEVEFFLGAANTSFTPDIQTAWATPGSSTGVKSCIGPTTAVNDPSAASEARFSLHGLGTVVTYGLSSGGAETFFMERGIVTVVTPGNIVLQWSQVSSSASATTLRAYSYMKMTKVS